MGLLAVKHLDPVVGVDVHSVLVTPGTPPVFLPHPHVGFMLDLREYVEAAKGVVGSIAMTIVEEKVIEYVEDHPDEVKKLEHMTDATMQQLGDMADVLGVADGLTLAKEGKKLANRISDDLGANVGAGGSSGRPIFVNGLLRATAGTHAYHVPGLHFPLGESFVPPPAENPEPSNDGESFMGSKTVLANNDPMSYMALQALSCWSIGMEPPPHNGAHTERTYPSMPSSVMLPIPVGRPVMVGGPPVVNMVAAAKGLFNAFRGSGWAKALADKLHLKSGFLRCNVLKAEPVDATKGEVVVQQRDFIVAERLPLEWDRYYSSHDTHAGAVGVGWQTPADIRLELLPNDGSIGATAYFPDHATAYDTLPAAEGWPARVYDWQHGHALYRLDDRIVLRTRTGIEYGFGLPPRWQHRVAMLEGDVRLKLHVERISDLNGNAWVFERDEHERLTRIAEWTRDGATARVIECVKRDSGQDRASGGMHAGWLIGLTLIDAGGHAHPLVTYEHDRECNLCAAVDAMAHPHRYDYDDGHRMLSHTSARGVSFYYHHCVVEDGVWCVDHAWGDDGLFDYRFTYDRVRMETRITDSRGYTSVLQLNERGMPVAEIDPLGSLTSYRYDAQWRMNAETDPAGRSTSWEYDRCGNLVAQTLPDGSAIRTEYDVDHRPVCVTLPGGRQWRYEWDAQGNLLAQATPSGATWHYAYERCGQPIKYTGPRGVINLYEYDRDGHLAALTDALGHRTRYRHDSRGNLVEVIDACGQASRYEYDRNGNLTRAIEPGGSEVHFAYDADDNLVRYRDSAGNLTQLAYSALGLITKRESPDGNIIEYRYDTEEQLAGVVNERGELYQLKRDGRGRIVEEIDYWGQTHRYEYGPRGELQRSINPAGQTIEYQSDALGRIVQKRVPDPRQPGGIRTETFSYDGGGNLVVAENPDSRVELTYDGAGRVVEQKQGDHFVIVNVFDVAGNRIERRTRLQSSSGTIAHTVRYDYDALGAVSAIKIDDAAPITFERDACGQIRVEHLGPELRRELSYTSDGLLAKQALLDGTGILFVSEYAHDANGELLEKRDSRLGVERFTYDPVGKLTGHLDPTGKLHRFLYDPAGDLLTTHVRDRVAAGADRAPQTGTWVHEGEYGGCYYAFDRAGNLVRKRDAQQDMVLRWDAMGQLVETVVVPHAQSGTANNQVCIFAQYKYDVFRRRVGKVVHARSTGSADRELSHVSYFFWDGNVLVGEHTAGIGAPMFNFGNRERAIQSASPEQSDREAKAVPSCERVYEWVYYPGTFRPLAAVYRVADWAAGVAGRQLFFLQSDSNGAPLRMHDALGNVAWEARYRPTGGVEAGAAPSCARQPIRLLGQYFDAETGFHYHGCRYFDPNTGRFISQDPLGIFGGLNIYQYAPNLFGWVDPLGLSGRKNKRTRPRPPLDPHDLRSINRYLVLAGIGALNDSEDDSDKSEAILENQNMAWINEQLSKANSRYELIWEVAFNSRGQRVSRWTTDSRRIEVAVRDNVLNKFVSALDISLNPWKRPKGMSVVKYYREFFGDIKVFDIRSKYICNGKKKWAEWMDEEKIRNWR
ncbi:RHS repeat-associated core domain-containing protein [Burkholderia ubonensis]|uniref:RHS repeat-associated core domain-containing protein n=1 Tax=Burkholderia ubonensis TaxID=101571 RepID=UPI0007C7FD7D|nr:RHS repeat-associated core domain-containing protein [Burkholderia ubonensis]